MEVGLGEAGFGLRRDGREAGQAPGGILQQLPEVLAGEAAKGAHRARKRLLTRDVAEEVDDGGRGHDGGAVGEDYFSAGAASCRASTA